jgi:hypothetical protein
MYAELSENRPGFGLSPSEDMSPGSGTLVPDMAMASKRREAVEERYRILCDLARQLPEDQRDSPADLARWLIDLRGRSFYGLAPLLRDTGERDRFEAWVKTGTQSSIAKAAQRAFAGKRERLASEKAPVTKQETPVTTLTIPESRPTKRSVPLLWPVGVKQHKSLEPGFKVPLLDGKKREDGRLFLHCKAAQPLYRVTALINGIEVGGWPAIGPNGFVELNWQDETKLSRAATYGGWRKDVLGLEDSEVKLAESTSIVSKNKTEMREPFEVLLEITREHLKEVRKISPPDIQAWSQEVREFTLEVTFTDASGTLDGRLSGKLLHSMESMWFRFVASDGFGTSIR